MKAVVLERAHELSIRDVDLPMEVGDHDVKIAIDTVGVCGSDVHYYTHGRIGDFVVRAPMVLGHEASGVVVEAGAKVTHAQERRPRLHGAGRAESDVPRLQDRHVQCRSRGSLLGDAAGPWRAYPLCRASRGLHLQDARQRFVRRGRDGRAVRDRHAGGRQGAHNARRRRGGHRRGNDRHDGRARGARRRVLEGVHRGFRETEIGDSGPLSRHCPVDVNAEPLSAAVARETGGWGADVVFEASGGSKAFDDLFRTVRPGGCVVLVGLPVDPVPFSVTAAAAKEVRIETVFRYANVFDRALALIGSGKVDLKPLISDTYPFADSIAAFERAAAGRPNDVKLQIRVADR